MGFYVSYLTNIQKNKSVSAHALVIGFVAGFGGGFVSLGGGTLAIPLLMGWVGLNAFQARGTALMIALFSASMASFVYHQGGSIDWFSVVLIALPSMILTPIMASYTEHFSNRVLKRIFGIVLIGGALALFLKDELTISALVSSDWSVTYLLAVGVIEGLVAGSVGVSGGPVLAPLLVLGLGMSQQLAQGCSLAARLPAIITGLIENIRHGHVCWCYVPGLAIGSLPGAWVGGKLALMLPEQHLRLMFAILLAALGVHYLFYKKK